MRSKAMHVCVLLHSQELYCFPMLRELPLTSQKQETNILRSKAMHFITGDPNENILRCTLPQVSRPVSWRSCVTESCQGLQSSDVGPPRHPDIHVNV
jgi:hypothetical protein